RIFPNGSTDTTFNPGLGPDVPPVAIAVQNDGGIIIAGSFHSYNGQPVNSIARITSGGALDPSFNAGAGVDNQIRQIAIQADGVILIAGPFTTVSGVSRNGIARLLSTGGVDASFDPGNGFPGTDSVPGIGPGGASVLVPNVTAMLLQSDGHLLIGGK